MRTFHKSETSSGRVASGSVFVFRHEWPALQIKKWRRALHAYDPPDLDDAEGSESASDDEVCRSARITDSIVLSDLVWRYAMQSTISREGQTTPYHATADCCSDRYRIHAGSPYRGTAYHRVVGGGWRRGWR